MNMDIKTLPWFCLFVATLYQRGASEPVSPSIEPLMENQGIQEVSGVPTEVSKTFIGSWKEPLIYSKRDLADTKDPWKVQNPTDFDVKNQNKATDEVPESGPGRAAHNESNGVNGENMLRNKYENIANKTKNTSNFNFTRQSQNNHVIEEMESSSPTKQDKEFVNGNFQQPTAKDKVPEKVNEDRPIQSQRFGITDTYDLLEQNLNPKIPRVDENNNSYSKNVLNMRDRKRLPDDGFKDDTNHEPLNIMLKSHQRLLKPTQSRPSVVHPFGKANLSRLVNPNITKIQNVSRAVKGGVDRKPRTPYRNKKLKELLDIEKNMDVQNNISLSDSNQVAKPKSYDNSFNAELINSIENNGKVGGFNVSERSGSLSDLSNINHAKKVRQNLPSMPHKHNSKEQHSESYLKNLNSISATDNNSTDHIQNKIKSYNDTSIVYNQTGPELKANSDLINKNNSSDVKNIGNFTDTQNTKEEMLLRHSSSESPSTRIVDKQGYLTINDHETPFSTISSMLETDDKTNYHSDNISHPVIPHIYFNSLPERTPNNIKSNNETSIPNQEGFDLSDNQDVLDKTGFGIVKNTENFPGSPNSNEETLSTSGFYENNLTSEQIDFQSDLTTKSYETPFSSISSMLETDNELNNRSKMLSDQLTPDLSVNSLSDRIPNKINTYNETSIIYNPVGHELRENQDVIDKNGFTVVKNNENFTGSSNSNEEILSRLSSSENSLRSEQIDNKSDLTTNYHEIPLSTTSSMFERDNKSNYRAENISDPLTLPPDLSLTHLTELIPYKVNPYNETSIISDPEGHEFSENQEVFDQNSLSVLRNTGNLTGSQNSNEELSSRPSSSEYSLTSEHINESSVSTTNVYETSFSTISSILETNNTDYRSKNISDLVKPDVTQIELQVDSLDSGMNNGNGSEEIETINELLMKGVNIDSASTVSSISQIDSYFDFADSEPNYHNGSNQVNKSVDLGFEEEVRSTKVPNRSNDTSPLTISVKGYENNNRKLDNISYLIDLNITSVILQNLLKKIANTTKGVGENYKAIINKKEIEVLRDFLKQLLVSSSLELKRYGTQHHNHSQEQTIINQYGKSYENISSDGEIYANISQVKKSKEDNGESKKDDINISYGKENLVRKEKYFNSSENEEYKDTPHQSFDLNLYAKYKMSNGTTNTNMIDVKKDQNMKSEVIADGKTTPLNASIRKEGKRMQSLTILANSYPLNIEKGGIQIGFFKLFDNNHKPEEIDEKNVKLFNTTETTNTTGNQISKFQNDIMLTNETSQYLDNIKIKEHRNVSRSWELGKVLSSVDLKEQTDHLNHSPSQKSEKEYLTRYELNSSIALGNMTQNHVEAYVKNLTVNNTENKEFENTICVPNSTKNCTNVTLNKNQRKSTEINHNNNKNYLKVKDVNKVVNRKTISKQERITEINEKLKQNRLVGKSKTVQAIRTITKSIDYE